MKTTTKRNISILSAVILSASIIIGGTLAYFYDKQEITNPFTTAGGAGTDTGVDITVTEPNYDPDTSQDMYPGTTITKDPTVTNDKGESYARFIVKLVEQDTDTVITDKARADKIMKTLFYDVKYATGKGQTLDTALGYTEAQLAALVGADVKTPVNPEFVLDTTRGGVGEYYFNYNGTLQNGDVKKLFTHVSIPSDWTQVDLALVGDFDLKVEGQAIQKANIADADTAFTALDGELATTP